MLSRQTDLWADYQVETDPATWPPTFRQLARYALAAEFAMAVTGSVAAAQLWHNKAFGNPGEGMAGGQARIARRVDAQQPPPQAVTDFPLIAARQGGWGR